MPKHSEKPVRPEVKTAIALFYDGTGAPQITAKGEHSEAEEIIRIANENNIPLCDNAALAGLLSHIELGERVPEELYRAVAHVIAFAYQLKTPTPSPLAPINNQQNPLKL